LKWPNPISSNAGTRGNRLPGRLSLLPNPSSALRDREDRGVPFRWEYILPEVMERRKYSAGMAAEEQHRKSIVRETVRCACLGRKHFDSSFY
jgi:hypothetical protein